jgi:hypothetical protein
MAGLPVSPVVAMPAAAGKEVGAFLTGVANRFAARRGSGGVDLNMSSVKVVVLVDLCLVGVSNRRGRTGDDGALSAPGAVRYDWPTDAVFRDSRGEEGCMKAWFAVAFEYRGATAESSTVFACNLLATGVLAIWNASRSSRRAFLGAVDGTMEPDGIISGSIPSGGRLKPL